MAGIELKIDDDYINGMASLFETRSQDLQEGVDSYLTILAGIRGIIIMTTEETCYP